MLITQTSTLRDIDQHKSLAAATSADGSGTVSFSDNLAFLVLLGVAD